MDIILRKELEEYKKTVLDLIEEVQKDQELSDQLLEKKNNILKEIRDAGYDKCEIERNIEELGITAAENELELTIKKEMVKIKKKIENIRTTKIARKNYNNQQRAQMVLFRGKA